MHARPAALLAAAVLLAGCRQEPDFDERYDKAEAAIRARAAAIDRDLAAAERKAHAAAAAQAHTPTGATPAGEPAAATSSVTR